MKVTSYNCFMTKPRSTPQPPKAKRIEQKARRSISASAIKPLTAIRSDVADQATHPAPTEKGVAKTHPSSAMNVLWPQGKDHMKVDLAALEQLVERKVAEALAARDEGLSKSIASARERGASYARQEWEKPDNLRLADAAAYAGRSDRVINEYRKNARYYALVLEGNTRGFRYPRWQFDADAGRVATVLRLLKDAGLSCWGIHQFLHSPIERAGGITARQIICDSKVALEPVLEAARQRYFSDQGAG